MTEEVEKYKCPYCEAEFDSVQALNAHLKSHKKGRKSTISAQDILEEDTDLTLREYRRLKALRLLAEEQARLRKIEEILSQYDNLRPNQSNIPAPNPQIAEIWKNLTPEQKQAYAEYLSILAMAQNPNYAMALMPFFLLNRANTNSESKEEKGTNFKEMLETMSKMITELMSKITEAREEANKARMEALQQLAQKEKELAQKEWQIQLLQLQTLIDDLRRQIRSPKDLLVELKEYRNLLEETGMITPTKEAQNRELIKEAISAIREGMQTVVKPIAEKIGEGMKNAIERRYAIQELLQKEIKPQVQEVKQEVNPQETSQEKKEFRVV
jgi:DNA repair exonuclease SbcCD ATPase subunit